MRTLAAVPGEVIHLAQQVVVILRDVGVTSYVLPTVTLKALLVVLTGLPAERTRISSRHGVVVPVVDQVMSCCHSTV